MSTTKEATVVKVRDVVAKSSGHFLQAGERVLGALVVLPAGGAVARGVTAGVGGGLLGRSIGNLAGRKHAGESGAGGTEGGQAEGFPRERVLLALTDRRLVALGVGDWNLKPKGFVAAFPRNTLGPARAERGRVTHHLTLSFADASSITLDVERAHADDLDVFPQILR